MNKLGAIAPGAGGLENVAGIFNQMAPMANLAGMNFDSAITLIGEMSRVTKNPEQMNGMTEGILKLFTNLHTITNKKGTFGKIIFDPDTGDRKNPLKILQGIKAQYDSLSSKKQIGMLTSLTGGADPRSMKFIQLFLKSDALNHGGDFVKLIGDALGKYEKQLPEATADAAHQAARLKNLLTDAGEQFARPIDRVLANIIKFGMDKANLKDVGGVGLGAAGAGTLIAGWYGSKLAKEFGGNIIGKFLGGKASLAGGVAEGAMLSRVGVTSVYVVNFGEMGNAMTGPIAGKFQEFLPGDSAVMPKAPGAIKALGGAGLAWGSSLGVAGIASIVAPAAAMVGVAYLANQASLKRRLAEQAREASLNGPRSDEEKYNLFSGRQSGIPTFDMPAPSVTIYVDNEKKKPTKTVIDKRGSFER